MVNFISCRKHPVLLASAFLVTLLVTGCGDLQLAGPPGDVVRFDAAVFQDAGETPLDAGTLDEDLGPITADGGPLPDGGNMLPDGGSTLPDAGSTDETALFVPDVPNTFNGGGVPPFTALAHTIVETDFTGTNILVAFRNDSDDPLCSLNLRIELRDGVGTIIDSDSLARVHYPPHRGVGGTGGFVSCVSPGGTIMVVSQYLDLGFRTVADIGSVTWTTGGLALVDAVPTSDLLVQNVSVVAAGSLGHRFTGTLRNNTGGSVSFPSVGVFGVNSVGRPFVFGSDIANTTISSGGSWSFETLTFQGVPTAWVAFPKASD